MTQEEMLKALIPDIKDTDIKVLLELSKGVILNAQYPFGYDGEENVEVENRYKALQVQMCVQMYNKQGAEGETQRSENGITRTYSTGDVSSDLIKRITPKCKVL